jgi:hypothetical protein
VEEGAEIDEGSGCVIAPHGWTAVSGRSEILSTSNIVELPSPIKKPLTLHTRSAAWPRGVPDNIAARPPRFLHEVVEHGDAALVISAIQVGQVLVPPCGYEGIQPFEGVDVLVDLGCDYGPGYAIKPASPAEDLDFGMQRANEVQRATAGFSSLSGPAGRRHVHKNHLLHEQNQFGGFRHWCDAADGRTGRAARLGW